MSTFTETQRNRLKELGVWMDTIPTDFPTEAERNQAYYKLEKTGVRENREVLTRLLERSHQPGRIGMQQILAKTLTDAGFTQVETPTIISRKFLERMTIDGTHPLNDQVFWLDQNSCLRPMLAPNLYDLSRSLMNVAKLPLGIFEIGSCFRKESQGKSHLKEFTMLNLVEWGTPMEKRKERLIQLAHMVLQAAQITDYQMELDHSVVYGEGIDFVSADGLELASTSMGPHPLDEAWNIHTSWVGVGFGLERLLMCREKGKGIHRHGRSLAFLDGARLNIK